MNATVNRQIADPVAVARSLIPILSRNAVAAEAERRAAPESIEAIREAGLFQMMFPKRAGGSGHKLITHIETVAELAKGCPGTAWAFGLLSGVTASTASMPAAISNQIFATGEELVCSVAGQIGTATPSADGYVVNGSWAYASGCMHADWALNGVRILDAEGKVVDAGLAFLPLNTDQVSIKETWQVTGLCASGSNTVVADNVVVPTSRVLRFSQLRAAGGQAPAFELEARDRWPVEPLFPLGVLSPMLGAAQTLLDLVAENMPKRNTVYWTYPTQSDTDSMVEQLGEAALEIDSAWLHIRRAAAMIDETAQTRPLTGFDKARIQADCGFAMRRLRAATDRLMEIAGPAAFGTHNPMQRFWRDLSLGTRHTALHSLLSSELYGRAMLGKTSTLTLMPNIARD